MISPDLESISINETLFFKPALECATLNSSDFKLQKRSIFFVIRILKFGWLVVYIVSSAKGGASPMAPAVDNLQLLSS